MFKKYVHKMNNPHLKVLFIGIKGTGIAQLIGQLSGGVSLKEEDLPTSFIPSQAVTLDGFSGIQYIMCIRNEDSINPLYSADVIIYVYDITNRSSFNSISLEHDPSQHRTIILLGCRDDQQGRQISYEEGLKLSSELGCHLFFEIGSAARDIKFVMEKACFHILNYRYSRISTVVTATPCLLTKRFIINDDIGDKQIQLNQPPGNNPNLFNKIVKNKYVMSIIWRHVNAINQRLNLKTKKFKDSSLLWLIHNKYFKLFDIKFIKESWQFDEIDFGCFLRSNNNYERFLHVIGECPTLLEEYKSSPINDVVLNSNPNIQILQYIAEYRNNMFVKRFTGHVELFLESIEDNNMKLLEFYVSQGFVSKKIFKKCKSLAKELNRKEILIYLKEQVKLLK